MPRVRPLAWPSSICPPVNFRPRNSPGRAPTTIFATNYNCFVRGRPCFPGHSSFLRRRRLRSSKASAAWNHASKTGSFSATTPSAALDATVTGMGARLLRSWVLRPLIEREAIEARLDAVTHLVQQTVLRGEIRKELKGILDLERLTSRITLGLATPRELVALRKSLGQLPVLTKFLTPPPAGGSELLHQLHQEIDELADVRDRLERAITDDPPALATDPGMIRSGYHAELDELRDLS